ncbi:uncharacterized protein LOC143425134 [Xylocopa sonorina]|uniref:uncharacterized protein LOC143425134 n=1 Tax=Xylocopa sonorina TaxID=1818115 RepID=UPI00403B321C
MDQNTITDRFLRDNKFFGQLVGVWPDQERFMKYSVRLITLVIIVLTNAAQISQVVLFYSVDAMTDQMPFLTLGFGLLLKQYNYILNENKLRKLFHGIVISWLTERSKEEFEILEMYARRAEMFSSVYKATAFSCVFMFILLPAIPPLLDIVVPLNESRSRVFIYPSYYFVDEERYYYLIVGHMTISAIILGFVFVACDLTLVQVVQHACALLVISGHRLKHAMDDADFYRHKGALTDECYAKVKWSIEAHTRANDYVKDVQDCHIYYFFCAIGMITMAFTVTFVKLTSMEMGLTYLTFCVFTAGQLIHFFFLAIMGQFAKDSNEQVFQKVCQAQWYNGSSRTQALYVLVLRKCLSSQKLTGGGLIELNLDSFVQVLKASFSYYTVLKSS